VTEPAHLYFDTETSDYYEDTAPALPVEIAFLLERGDRILAVFSTTLDQAGWHEIRWNPIAQRVIDKHGVDESMSRRYGLAPEVVLNIFRKVTSVADVVVGHNISFDLKVIDWAFSVQCLPPLVWPEAKFCTMRESAEMVGIPSGGRYAINGYKAPKLEEAYRHFTGRELGNAAHRAMGDVYATRAVHRHILLARSREQQT